MFEALAKLAEKTRTRTGNGQPWATGATGATATKKPQKPAILGHSSSVAQNPENGQPGQPETAQWATAKPAEDKDFLGTVAQVAQVAQRNDRALHESASNAEDWRAFFDEPAGGAEFDAGHTRAKAEAIAFECCIVEWLNRHPEPSDPGRCAWCEIPDQDGPAVVPFGTESYGHTWLHPECWNNWIRRRREKAQQALTVIGLEAPPKCAKGSDLPDDFGKN